MDLPPIASTTSENVKEGVLCYNVWDYKSYNSTPLPVMRDLMLFQEDNMSAKSPLKQEADLKNERRDLLKLQNKEFLLFKQDPGLTSLPEMGVGKKMKGEPPESQLLSPVRPLCAILQQPRLYSAWEGVVWMF